MIFTALDTETASKLPEHDEYALQPWRIREGTAMLTATSIGKSDGRSKVTSTDHLAFMQECRGTRLALYNSVFDLAVLMAAGFEHEVVKHDWADAMLMWRWLDNSQRTERGGHEWSLTAAAKRFLKDWEHLPAFLSLKAEEHTAGDDDQYWETRARMDTVATAMVTERVWSALDEKRRRGTLIQAQCLVPIARSWLQGIHLDRQAIHDMRPHITKEMAAIEAKLGLVNPGTPELDVINGAGTWKPSAILRSPSKKSTLLYDTWGLPIDDQFRSQKTSNPGTGKDAVTYLADVDPRCIDLLRWSELNTQLTKFIESPLKAMDYLGKEIVHPSPRIFGTYTGRMTYSSKTKKKYPTGVALHQWPRNKELRACILPPPGYDLVEFDAAGQEMRLIAEESQDETMLRLFSEGMDTHSFMGSQLSNIPYQQFMEMKAANVEEVTGPHGWRYFGKFGNLSNQYRVGVKKLRIMARIQYGLDIDLKRSKEIKTTYGRTYPGVTVYWKNAPNKARHLGYAETPLGRRFKLTDWNVNEWGTSSSAINFPIQGGGADMKELAVAVVSAKHPQMLYGFDLHDALFMYKPKTLGLDILRDVKQSLNDLDYQKYWGWTPSVDLIWEGEYGPSWGKMEEV